MKGFQIIYYEQNIRCISKTDRRSKFSVEHFFASIDIHSMNDIVLYVNKAYTSKYAVRYNLMQQKNWERRKKRFCSNIGRYIVRMKVPSLLCLRQCGFLHRITNSEQILWQNSNGRIHFKTENSISFISLIKPI